MKIDFLLFGGDALAENVEYDCIPRRGDLVWLYTGKPKAKHDLLGWKTINRPKGFMAMFEVFGHPIHMPQDGEAIVSLIPSVKKGKS